MRGTKGRCLIPPPRFIPVLLVVTSALLVARPLAADESPPPAASGDWPQWRGPGRDGLAAGGRALAPTWPADGPPLVWKVDGIPSGGDGGYASPVVAGGRVYLYVNRKYQVPIQTRRVSEDVLRRLGWVPDRDRPPADVLAAAEAARAGPERNGLKGKALEEWADGWIKAHLDEQQKKKAGGFLRGRLLKGPDAIPMQALDALAARKDKPFATPAEFEAWLDGLDGQGLTGDVRKQVVAAVPTAEPKQADLVLCLDSGTGKEAWRVETPGGGGEMSSTVCVAGGRCYGLGSAGQAFCLDAATGREVWRVKCKPAHSSFLVEQGRAVILADVLTALDAETGSVVWTQPKVKGRDNSPVAWFPAGPGGPCYILCNTVSDVACVDLADGKVRWTVSGGGHSTAAVSGDRMVVLSEKPDVGLSAYRITPEKAERVWNVPTLTDRGASPIVHGGRVYAVAAARTACVDLESGRVVWEGRPPGNGDISSPVLADGKLVALLGNGRMLALLRATPDGPFAVLAKAKVALAPCASPAVAGGKLYVRTTDGLACYDLKE